MWPNVRDQRVFLASVAAVVLLAWATLWAWTASPYARFLSHGENAAGAADAPYPVVLLVFAAGWTVMTVAMMLPTSLPLIAVFRSLVRQRANRAALVALVIAGYLAVWLAFALVVYVADLGLHRFVEHVAWLEENSWVIPASALVMAGIYEFTPLKYRC